MSFIKFYSHSYVGNNIVIGFNTYHIQLRIIPVTRENGYGFQPENLLWKTSVLPIVNYSVQLDVIGRVGQNTMHDDNLFPCYHLFHPCQIYQFEQQIEE